MACARLPAQCSAQRVQRSAWTAPHAPMLPPPPTSAAARVRSSRRSLFLRGSAGHVVAAVSVPPEEQARGAGPHLHDMRDARFCSLSFASLKMLTRTSPFQDTVLRRRSAAAAPPLPLSAGGASLGAQSAAALPLPLSASDLFPSQHAPLTALLLLWCPLGSVLAPLRIAVWLFCAALDSPGLTNSDAALDLIITQLLGVTTEWKGLENVPPGMHVMVSNHSCVGDFLLLYRQPRRYTHLIHAAVPTGGRVTQHRVSFMHTTPSTFKSLRREAALDSSNSIHMFPEACMSSGKAVLQFSRGFALLQAPVLPVAFRATHALGISTHTLTSSFAANLWWLCFAPWTRLQATVLPAMRQGADEETEAFVERVRDAIADELRVPKVQLGVKDKYGLKEAMRAVPHARL